MLAAPSVPRPSATPAARYSGTGAVPLASFMLLSGLCETPTPRAFSIAMSSSVDPDAVRRERPGAQKPIDCRDTPTGVALTPLLRGLDLVLAFRRGG